MPTGVSAVPQTSGTTKKEMDYAGWDPQFQVPVVEILGYDEVGGTAALRRVGVSATSYLMVSGSTGGGTLSLAGDAASNRVSAFQTDAGLLHVSAIGGTNSPLSADSSSVSAKQESATNLRVSAFSNDAGLLHVSAIGGTSSPLSADSSSVSAKQEDASNLRVSARGTISAFINEGTVSARQGTTPWGVNTASGQAVSASQYGAWSLSAAITNASIPVTQSGTWSLSSLLTEGTAFAGNVSATIKNYPLVVSGQVSANIDSGSVSAKSGDANQLHVSAVQGDAGLLHVSAVGGTAGDNVVVDGTDQTLSATIQRVSGTVSSGANALNVYAQNRDDASNLRVSARGTVSSFINEGSVSAKQGTYPWSVSGNISAALNEGTNFLGNISATIKNYPVTVSGTISAFINQGTVSAAGGSLSALLKEGTAFVGQVSAAGGQLSATLKEGTAFIGQTSAQLVANTVGTLSIYRTLNVSASQAVKATAGSLYGYYLANSDTKFNYIKFYNTSGAINVGTDTPILTIPIPPSAAANVEFPHGLIGFTNGIGIAALSAIADSATTASPASAVVANIFYK